MRLDLCAESALSQDGSLYRNGRYGRPRLPARTVSVLLLTPSGSHPHPAAHESMINFGTYLAQPAA